MESDISDTTRTDQSLPNPEHVEVISGTPKEEEFVRDIFQQGADPQVSPHQRASSLSPQQAGVNPLVPQQQTVTPHRPEDQEAIRPTFQQETLTSRSPEQQKPTPHCGQELDDSTPTTFQQGASRRSSQQQGAMSPTLQEQENMSLSFQQDRATSISPQQQEATPRREQDYGHAPQTSRHQEPRQLSPQQQRGMLPTLQKSLSLSSQLERTTPISPQQRHPDLAPQASRQQRASQLSSPRQKAMSPTFQQQERAAWISPQQQGAIPRRGQGQSPAPQTFREQETSFRSPQQQKTMSPTLQEQGAMSLAWQQARATSISRQQQRTNPRRDQEQSPAPQTSREQETSYRSPQQQKTMSPTLQEQGAMSLALQQERAAFISCQQQRTCPRRNQEQSPAPQTSWQQEVSRRSPQQQETMSSTLQEQGAMSIALQQERATVISRQQQIISPRRDQEQSPAPETSWQQEGSRRSSQQQETMSSTLQEQGAMSIALTQEKATFISSQQQKITPRRDQERSPASQTFREQEANRRSSQQQGDMSHEHQEQRAMSPYCQQSRQNEPEKEIKHMNEGRDDMVPMPGDTHQPVPQLRRESYRDRACQIDGTGKKMCFYFNVILIVGSAIAIYFLSVHWVFRKSPISKYRSDTAFDRSVKVSRGERGLDDNEYDLNPCNHLYHLACVAPHKGHHVHGNYQWHVQSSINMGSQMEEEIKYAITDIDDYSSYSFTHNFDIVRKFYRLCTTDPDEKAAKEFYQLLNKITKAVNSSSDALVQLTTAALENGIFAYVFAKLSLVETNEGLAEFEVTLPQIVVNRRYERMWQHDKLGKIKALIGSQISSKDLFEDGKLEQFALDILSLVKTTKSSTHHREHDWLKGSLVLKLFGESQLLRYRISLTMEQYLQDLNVLISNTNLDIVVNYFKIMVIIRDCVYLPRREMNGCANFHGKRLFEDTCYSIARNSSWFQGLHAFEYAKEYISDTNRKTLNKITHSIIETVKKRLIADRWLNSIAINGALKHIDSLSAVFRWQPYIELKDVEQKSYPHLYKFEPGSSLPHFVASIRKNYTYAQILKTRLSPQDLDIVNQMHRPMANLDWANYHPLTNQIVVNPLAFEMFPSNHKEDLPMYHQMATLGAHIATAVLKSFNFPNTSKDSCIAPSEFWKYNLKLYSENVAKCTELQFNQYKSISSITDATTQSIFDYDNIFDIIGPRLAFTAYQLFFEEESVDKVDAKEKFWIILTSYRCESNRNFETEYLGSNFHVVGPAFTSKEFDLVFYCSKYTNMFSGSVCLTFQT